ncbi:DNA topoisomerase 6 subunit B [Trifolium repens]|nr:DNA topoisomerase 6 subunit B [Trifolium repens]
MANIGPFEMLYGDFDTDFTEEDPEENRRSVKETLQSLYRVARELAPRAVDERLPVYDDEEDFDEIKDALQAQEIKPKLTRDEAATLDAVKNVFEKAIQLPTLKNICDVHHLDQQILTKVFENLNNSITQETLNQLTNRRLQLLGEDNEKASPVPLQVPPHDTDKVQPTHEHQERKTKLPSYISDSAAAEVNNVLEEMTQLPASKKIRYAHDDVKSAAKKIQKLARMEKLD